MQVIGAGFGRTGTMSMQAALEILGYRCYHMKELTEHPGHLQAWHELVAERAPMDWQALFQDFQATVDFPACAYYRELMQEFPDAKVVLNVRDSDRWFDSFQTLQQTTDRFRVFRFIPRARRFLDFVDLLLPKVFTNPRDRARCIEVFQRHNREVQEHVPPDRLLVFQVQDGWEPLCKFLGRDVPAGILFPHLNEGSGTLERLARERLFGRWIRATKISAAAAALMLLVWWLFR
ncbi:MAG: sulfotransferase family protein [Pirellulales bacterium]